MSKLAGAAIVSLVVSLLLLEGAIRLLDLFPEPRAVTPRDAEPEQGKPGFYRNLYKTQLHPYRGWSFRPGTDISEGLALVANKRGKKGENEKSSKPSEWELSLSRVNQFGFFSALDDYRELREEDFVVAIFGGSVAGALVTSGGPTLLEALSARLPERADDIVLVSLAAPAYKQPQQLIILMEMALLGVPLDVVVNFDGFNEVNAGSADSRAGFHPYFPSRRQYAPSIDLATGVPSNALIVRSAEVIRERDAERRLAVWARDSELAGFSALARTLAGALALRHGARARIAEDALQRESAQTDQGDASAGLGDPCLGAGGDCSELIAEIWSQASLLMHGVAENIGAHYLHVLQPSQYVDGSKRLTDEERARAFAPEGPAALGVRRGYPHLLERGAWLRSRGVAFHDFTGLFETHDETIYFDRCCHYNHRGNAVVATAIAELIANARRADDSNAEPPPDTD